jgi:2,4-dienoyl-CoA reductase-like NADH-dependent reductase (Old Yellow Enzyme family)
MSDPLKVFQPWTHGALKLRNRVVMAPMTRRQAGEDGIPTAAMTAYYRRRAAAEVGLIISEGTAIDSRHAFDTLTVPRFETAPQLAAWKRIVDAVHAEGGAFAPQLWHTGRMAADPIGPSEGPGPPRADGTPRPPSRAMTAEDFSQVLEAYAGSAADARRIGCDAVEIHGAHGYLLDSFLSPVDNRRTDAYGGSVENRRRFPLEVARTVREAVGPGFPVIYRFSQWKMDDYRQQKFRTPDDLAEWVTALREAGMDILHVSTRDAAAPGFEDAGAKTLAAWTRELSGLPVIAVGKVSVTLPMDRAYGTERDVVTNPGPYLEMVERGEVDLLAVGRALIANPEWVPLVRAGRWRELQPFNKGLLDRLV